MRTREENASHGIMKIMKRLILSLGFLFSLFLFFAGAVSKVTASSSGYAIESFGSKIEINQDTSLTIEEAIEVNFSNPKHGIFRIIPVIYTNKGKTIRAKLKVLSVTDETGQQYQYQTSRYNQSIKIKIGDSEKTITGPHIYVIKYKINKVLLPYEDHDEIYWNVTGHEWDTTIKKATAVIKSPTAPITKISCFAGRADSQEKQCRGDFISQEASFTATVPINPGSDFTIVIALDKNNQLRFPGPIKKIANFLLDNWGYLIAVTPLLIIFVFWYKKGRDQRYLTDNIYYQPKNKKTKTVSLFARKYLPTVYSPIDNLTPAQVGTIIDEKVDTKDIVAEIIELARLKYLRIKKVERKKLIGKKTDYLFIKKDKSEKDLKDYQKYLLESLFINDEEIALSDLKNKFYQYLSGFKKKLYQNLADENFFAGNPEKVRILWIVLAAVMFFGSFFLLTMFSAFYNNAVPMILFFLTALPVVLLARSMPRRTAWGYSLYRQIEGLRWYINKGKWREKIAEKHLFLGEILPLAIALGVVKKLAKDMAELGVRPPDYFEGVMISNLYTDLNNFCRDSAATLVSSPSGKSSWSGGSGFSGGGSSGGGFGGGGGGNW